MSRYANRKLAGERAECAFVWQAMEHGLIVSKPYGDSAAYDFIVQRRVPMRSRASSLRRSLLRVQVKSVWCQDAQSRYTVNTRRSLSRSYRRGELDFFACWIVPLDLWYIIPASLVGASKCAHLYAHVPRSRGQYERYREAWRLLR